MVYCTKVVSFILKVFEVGSVAITQVFKPSRNWVWTFVSLIICRLKMSSFTYTWNHQKKINVFRDILNSIKVVYFFLKVFRVGSVTITQAF